jgi:predicted enzyme related to lactoylglutathione lyase
MSFYRTVFGWTFERYGQEDYWFAVTGDAKQHGINGAVMKKRDPRQPIVNSIQVDDLDAMTQKVEAAGGQVVVPKQAVPAMGWLCFFKDPDGHIHGMWQHDKEAK